MTASNDDFLFAQEAQALGYVSQAQVEEAFQLQRIMAEQLKIDERLAVLLVKRGWLAEEQARRVYARIEPEGKKTEIPGYRLLEFIGRGAMGTVYKAQHLGLQRLVAIKVLHKDLAADTTQVERLKSEAKLLASLDHPNIVRALDAGESNGFPYVVMEYVEGETLRERLQREKRLPEAEALRITRGLADALERARRMGVVHRDVKPGNVLLTRQGEPKLMDLGLAKGPMDLELTQHGATVGTPQYISPEQAQDPRKADIRSDIYSLGATLYALLTGRPPFEGTTLTEILTKVLYETPTPPRVLNPDVSAEVGYLIERMMLKDPSLRYHTPAEVVADIDRILDGRSIMPAGFRGNWEAYLLRRRIHRAVTVGAITLAAVLALGFGAKVWHEARTADAQRAEARERIQLLLPETGYGIDDTLLSVQSKLLRIDEALGRIEPLDLPETEALTARRGALRALLESFQGWHRLMGDAMSGGRKPDEPSVLDHVKRHAYAAALSRIQAFQPRISPPGGDNPVHVLAEAERGRLRLESREVFLAQREEARGRHPTTLESWVEGFEDYDRKAQAGFILEAEVKDGVPEAANLLEAARAVHLAVLRLEARYAPKILAERLGRLEIRGLDPEIRQAKQEVLEEVRRAWSGAALGWTGLEALLSPGGLVLTRVEEVQRRCRDQVKAQVTAVVAKAEALHDSERLEEVLEELHGLWSALGFADYRDLASDVDKAFQRFGQAAQARAQTAQAAYDHVFARWLAHLRALEAGTPGLLAADLELTDTDRAALGAKRVDVDDLRSGSEGVGRLYDLAMQGAKTLLGDRRLRLVAGLRKGAAPDKGWIVQEVDPEARTLAVAAGSEREPLRLSLFALTPAAIVDLAARARAAPEGRWALALGALALLPPAEAVLTEDADLGAALEAYGRARRAFEEAGSTGALARHVNGVIKALEAEMAADEATAAACYENVRIFMNQRRFSTVVWYLQQLLERQRLKRTKVFRENETAVREALKQAHEVMGEANMGLWLPGVRAKHLEDRPQGGTWELLYDFDTTEQLLAANFPAGAGVLEPYAGPSVTPGLGNNQRLHLLRGFEEPARDYPLSWRSIFDPLAPITLEFALYTLDRPFLIAVDLDGVQAGVLCLDPNWFSEFQFAADVPLLEGESERKRPTLDGQGRGRGVAFHGGPDFGDIPGWSLPGRGPGSAWTPEGRGRHLQEWRGRAFQPDRMLGLDRLFAFPPASQDPGHHYLVRVARERGRISLYVNGTLVSSEAREEWARLGSGERGSGMANGTGLIQILTWTPMAIDDLRLIGTVKRSWLREKQGK